ncbi:hypothetical protein GON03_09525 [Nocardioides sp. MAH-18]|uniref:PqqD family peptide modification chaperone n=1 Tax=Nocardioides agri TaxID=2682843 RepID=A0A6L6XQ09_9ACTN|nr:MULTISPECIES: hypothetical protein [unclassified Nocardioides]MBA2954562.1 hypothetical protein [Nocardioides sp. CGMCC 1.13656]MVQ49421.1 hypothetical protein [Nocardioides sp. MAH-18]
MRVQSAVLESYEEDGETAVLLDDQVLVLSPLAAFIVAAAGAGGVEVEDLHVALVAEFGAPPTDDPLAATRGAVETLIQTGALTEASPEPR